MHNKPFHKLSVLIAAYNEEATVKECVTRVMSAQLPGELDREIIIVDDGSKDSTWQILQELALTQPEIIRVFRQETNQGKGAAIRRAIQESSGDLAIFQDADLEYDPQDFQRLLRPIIEGRADVVFGSRLSGEERRVFMFWHAAANHLLTLLSNVINDTNWTDMETCYKAFKADCLRRIPLESNRFGIEPEIAAKVARNRLRMYEVGIHYNGRSYADGKKITWRDGFAALWYIVKYRFSSSYSDTGTVTLDALEQAPRFNQWMYDTVSPWVGNRVAELGSGSGNMSRLLLGHQNVLLTDYRDDYVSELRARWQARPNLSIERLDLNIREDYSVLRDFKPEGVVLLNVLEHIEDDRTTLRNIYESLPEQSRLIVLVPYDPNLYSELDRALGHYRRYNKGELEEKLKEVGFQVERQMFFNKVGKLGWYVANTLGGQKTLKQWQLKVYNLLTPLFRIVDRILPWRGLSTIVIASKP